MKNKCEHKRQSYTHTCNGAWNECVDCNKKLAPDIYKAEEWAE